MLNCTNGSQQTFRCISIHFHSSHEVSVTFSSSPELRFLLLRHQCVMELLSSFFPIHPTPSCIVYRDHKITAIRAQTDAPVKGIPPETQFIYATFYALSPRSPTNELVRLLATPSDSHLSGDTGRSECIEMLNDVALHNFRSVNHNSFEAVDGAVLPQNCISPQDRHVQLSSMSSETISSVGHTIFSNQFSPATFGGNIVQQCDLEAGIPRPSLLQKNLLDPTHIQPLIPPPPSLTNPCSNPFPFPSQLLYDKMATSTSLSMASLVDIPEIDVDANDDVMDTTTQTSITSAASTVSAPTSASITPTAAFPPPNSMTSAAPAKVRRTSGLGTALQTSTSSGLITETSTKAPLSVKSSSPQGTNSLDDDDVIICKVILNPTQKNNLLKREKVEHEIPSSIPSHNGLSILQNNPIVPTTTNVVRGTQLSPTQACLSLASLPPPPPPPPPPSHLEAKSSPAKRKPLSKTCSHFSDLNVSTKVLDKVISFLPMFDRLNCRLVCSTWRRLIDTSPCWQNISILQSQIKNWDEAAIQLCYFGNCQRLAINLNGDCDKNKRFSFERLCSLVHSSHFHLKHLHLEITSPESQIRMIWLDELIRPLQTIQTVTLKCFPPSESLQIKLLSSSPDNTVNSALRKLITDGLVNPDFIETLSTQNFPQLKEVRVFCSSNPFINRLKEISLSLVNLERICLNFSYSCEAPKTYFCWLSKLQKLSALGVMGLRCTVGALSLFSKIKRMKHLKYLCLDCVMCTKEIYIPREIISRFPENLISLVWLIKCDKVKIDESKLVKMVKSHFEQVGNKSISLSIRISDL